MKLSASEQNHIAAANERLCGIAFPTNICENGTRKTDDMTQTVEISAHTNQTTYPERKYYNIKIKQSYARVAPCQTAYSYSVYVDETETITEITPLYIVNDTGRHQQRKAATKADYHTAVYRLILGTEATKLL